MKLDILHQDEHVVVVNKPSGLLSIPDRYNAEIPNLTALLGRQLNGPVKAVHRLDRPTSGIIIVARTTEAHRELNRQFEQREIDKVYHAIVDGQPPLLEETEVDEPIASNPGQTGMMMVSNRGKYAMTLFRAEEHLGNGFAYVGVQIFTGRTHQIRVHLAHRGHPLLGDGVYGAAYRTKSARLPEAARAALAELPGQALHAASLAFAHPRGGDTMRFDSAPPDHYARLVNALRDG